MISRGFSKHNFAPIKGWKNLIPNWISNKQALFIVILKETYKLSRGDHLALKTKPLKERCFVSTIASKNSSFVVIYRKVIPFQNACSKKYLGKNSSFFIFGKIKWLINFYSTGNRQKTYGFLMSSRKHELISSISLNPLQPGIAFLYPLKASENLKVFWCFQGV